ncbi:MAG: EI24 domain-containing protein [Lentisphaeria bacterium]|nr:EI24 domain-containing protein [Lentisphaeria bacterium]
MIKNFFRGFLFAFAGIKYFYSDPKLWKYILPVWVIVSLLYVLLIRLLFKGTQLLTGYVEQFIRNWPEFLRVAAEYTMITGAAITASIFVLATFCTFFEASGGIFFDKLTENFEKKYYRHDLPQVPILQQIFFNMQAVWAGIKNFFLLLLLIIFTGAVITLLVMAPRMARSLIYPAGFLHGKGVKETSVLLKQRKAELYGFGIAVCLLQMFPFSLLFTLPGLIIGAAIFYNGKFPDDSAFVEPCDRKIS